MEKILSGLLSEKTTCQNLNSRSAHHSLYLKKAKLSASAAEAHEFQISTVWFFDFLSSKGTPLHSQKIFSHKFFQKVSNQG